MPAARKYAVTSACALSCTVALASLACSRNDSATSGSPAVSSAIAAAVPASAAAAPGAAAPLSGLDTCLVGKWKASGATLKVDPIDAQGGANVTLDVAPSGASVIDFGPMEDVHAKGPSMSFDFRYAGKASAMLKSTTRGTLESSNADYSGLRVTATVKLPGAGNIPLFKDKPLTELASLGTALAGASKGLPGAKPAAGAAAAPSASQLGTPGKGIDSSPVFASNRYTCEGDALSLRGTEQSFVWQFVRVR